MAAESIAHEGPDSENEAGEYKKLELVGEENAEDEAGAPIDSPQVVDRDKFLRLADTLADSDLSPEQLAQVRAGLSERGLLTGIDEESSHGSMTHALETAEERRGNASSEAKSTKKSDTSAVALGAEQAASAEQQELAAAARAKIGHLTDKEGTHSGLDGLWEKFRERQADPGTTASDYKALLKDANRLVGRKSNNAPSMPEFEQWRSEVTAAMHAAGRPAASKEKVTVPVTTSEKPAAASDVEAEKKKLRREQARRVAADAKKYESPEDISFAGQAREEDYQNFIGTRRVNGQSVRDENAGLESGEELAHIQAKHEAQERARQAREKLAAAHVTQAELKREQDIAEASYIPNLVEAAKREGAEGVGNTSTPSPDLNANANDVTQEIPRIETQEPLSMDLLVKAHAENADMTRASINRELAGAAEAQGETVKALSYAEMTKIHAERAKQAGQEALKQYWDLQEKARVEVRETMDMVMETIREKEPASVKIHLAGDIVDDAGVRIEQLRSLQEQLGAMDVPVQTNEFKYENNEILELIKPTKMGPALVERWTPDGQLVDVRVVNTEGSAFERTRAGRLREWSRGRRETKGARSDGTDQALGWLRQSRPTEQLMTQVADTRTDDFLAEQGGKRRDQLARAFRQFTGRRQTEREYESDSEGAADRNLPTDSEGRGFEPPKELYFGQNRGKNPVTTRLESFGLGRNEIDYIIGRKHADRRRGVRRSWLFRPGYRKDNKE